MSPLRITRVLPLDQLWVLEMAGISPEDTVVTFGAADARTIILRHGPPDNTVFVEVIFPESVFVSAGTPESVTAVLSPRPGIYGLDLALTSLPARAGSSIRFKYPVHFSAPLAAVRQHHNATRFEQSLTVAMQVEGGRFGLLASERPASDNLAAPLPGPGTYLVVGPRDGSGGTPGQR